MAKTYVQDGNVINYTNTGSAISSGDVVLIGGNIGVALTDIAATTGVGAVAIEGCFELPATSASVIAAGERLIWDVSGTAFDDAAATPASGDVSNGAIALEACIDADVLVKVKLIPGVGTVT